MKKKKPTRKALNNVLGAIGHAARTGERIYVKPAPSYSGIPTYTQHLDYFGERLLGGPVTLAKVWGCGA